MRFGIDRLLTEPALRKPLVGRRVALLAHPASVTHWFGRLARSVGVACRLHDLRHFAATQALDAGLPVVAVSRRLGHARSSTTLDVYGHWVPDTDQEVAGALGRLLVGDESA